MRDSGGQEPESRHWFTCCFLDDSRLDRRYGVIIKKHGKTFISAIAGVALVGALSACGSESTESSGSCPELDPAYVTSLNDTLVAYEQGETVTTGTSINVDIPSAGTMSWDLLVAAKLDASGQVGLWAFNTASGFVVPLNDAAIASMPDAAVTDGSAASGALNSPEGQAALACIQ